jgi:hypothetical protein
MEEDLWEEAEMERQYQKALPVVAEYEGMEEVSRGQKHLEANH